MQNSEISTITGLVAPCLQRPYPSADNFKSLTSNSNSLIHYQQQLKNMDIVPSISSASTINTNRKMRKKTDIKVTIYFLKL